MVQRLSGAFSLPFSTIQIIIPSVSHPVPFHQSIWSYSSANDTLSHTLVGSDPERLGPVATQHSVFNSLHLPRHVNFLIGDVLGLCLNLAESLFFLVSWGIVCQVHLIAYGNASVYMQSCLRCKRGRLVG